MMKHCTAIIITLLLTLILVIGCSPITSPDSDLLPSGSDLPDGMGRLVVNVTDPPPPDMERVIVTVKNLEVHKAGGPWTVVAQDMEPFDLKLLEDREDLLTDAIVDEGIYTQIRLDIESVIIWVADDETQHEARVPSGKIKLVGSFNIIDGGETEITIDFIGAESVNVTGNGEYIFKPVIRLLIPESAKPGEEENSETTETLSTEPTETVTT